MSSPADGTAPAGATRSRRAAWRARATPWIERALDSPLGVLWARLVELEFIDRSVALAAKAFVALFPLLLAVLAFAPRRVADGYREGLVDRMGLSGGAADAVRDTFATTEAFRSATGFFGILLLIFYATTFTTALQRVFLRAWRRPPPRGVKQVRGLAWIAGVVAYVTLLSGARAALRGDLADGVTAVVALAGSFGLWWWSQYVLLYGQVRWRALVAPSAAIALGTGVYSASAVYWLPRTIEANQEQFGFFGVAMALVSWLVGSAFILVVGSAVGPVLAADEGALGRWALGPNRDPLRPGAAPALPGPAGLLPLARALGRGGSNTET